LELGKEVFQVLMKLTRLSQMSGIHGSNRLSVIGYISEFFSFETFSENLELTPYFFNGLENSRPLPWIITEILLEPSSISLNYS